MELLAFNIKGDTAFFNTNSFDESDMHFSFAHLHRVALLGILGAKIGLNGHNKLALNKEKESRHPEFYEKLKDLGVAIAPKSGATGFVRKEYSFTNGAGYSKGTGKYAQNLIYTEQWLHNVSWDVYLDFSKVDTDIAEKLKDFIINNKTVYPIYLGKTNHFAEITNGRLVEAIELANTNELVIDSLFKEDFIEKMVADLFAGGESYVDTRETLPSGYKDEFCEYVLDIYCLTDKEIKLRKDFDYKLAEVDGINICLA